MSPENFGHNVRPKIYAFHLFRIRRQGLFSDLLKTRLIAHFRHYRQGASNWLAVSYGQIKGFCFLGFALQSHRTTEGFTHGVGSRSTKRIRFQLG